MARSKLFSKLSEHAMQHSLSITPMITLNESSLSGLIRTSVTNSWIVYQIEGAVVVKKVTYQHPFYVNGLMKQKGCRKRSGPFLARVLIRQATNALHWITVWLHETTCTDESDVLHL